MERPHPERPWNPVEPLPPREQAVERALVHRDSPDDDEEENLKQQLAEELFGFQPERVVEMEKSPEEVAVIETAIAALSETVRRYGGRPLPLKAEHFHLLNLKDMADDERDRWEGCGGYYNSATQSVAVLLPGATELNKVDLLRRVLHEGMHFNSFQSVDLSAGGELNQRRLGVLLKSNGAAGEIGRWLNEAITEIMAKGLTKKVVRDNDLFHDEIITRKDLLPELPPGIPPGEVMAFDVLAGDKVKFHAFPYRPERYRLMTLLDDLAAKHPDRFSDRQAAFDVFARAYFTGNLLPLGRLLEDTYGPHALRRLMEGEEIIKKEKEG